MRGSCVVVVVVGLVFVRLLSCFVVVDCRGEECLEEERSLLLQLKNSMNLPSNNSLVSDWTGLNCCRWDGVYCSNSTSRVYELYLSSIREEEDGIWYPNVTMLAQFKELQYLHLSDNKMGGSVATLQAFCKLSYLKELDLSLNLLEGNIPRCFGDLKFLQALDLGGNQLQGNILSTFSNMHSLQSLDLNGNQLQGTISPYTFRNMRSLEMLDLSDNQLQGTISPFTFSNLTMIEYIKLSNNLLVGPFPFSMFANLSKLEILALSNNDQLEVETESPTWVPKFQLKYLSLSNCKLNSHSGSIIPSFISTHDSLYYLDLTSNSLEGDIPSWLLYNSTQSYLMLKNNSLSGQFPLPFPNTTLSVELLDISNNFVYGSLPVNFFDHFPILNYFDMSTNALQGNLPVPPVMGTVNLRWLALSNNNFSGKIPSSLMRGGFPYGLLDLSNNRLQGEMLPANSSMEGLVCLKLDGNEFTIPPNISKVPNLRILNIRNNHLSGNISSWLQVHHNLTVFFLGRNHFEGPIPWQICRMKSLRYLDLSNSNLGGTIPSCLANVPSWKSMPPIDVFNHLPGLLSNDIPIDFISKGILYNYIGRPAYQMTLIDLSMNKLSGTIPFEMGNMRGVKALNLSHNLLEGLLLMSFQNMKNLESLDLSHNTLNGTIPEEITELDFLTTFIVAFNNLSGEIPYRGKLFTFNDSSYEGNPGLCGKPLKKNCSSEDQERGGGGGGGEHGILDSELYFYSCIAISYCMGFWGFIAFLFFSKNSRRNFFITADAVQDWFFVKFWRIVCYFRSRSCN